MNLVCKHHPHLDVTPGRGCILTDAYCYQESRSLWNHAQVSYTNARQTANVVHAPARMALTGCFLLVAFLTTGALVAAGATRAGGAGASVADVVATAVASGPLCCAGSWRSIETGTDSWLPFRSTREEREMRTTFVKQSSANSYPLFTLMLEVLTCIRVQQSTH